MDPEGLVGRTLVGRFRIDRILGRGGMATVYAAFDQHRGVPVALKVLKRELTRDSMVLRRFEREAKAASHLQHPNVVEVLDWGVEGDEAFISMELAQGTDLLKALAKQRPMKQVRAVIVLSQVCSALSAAHSKGIVHRDLKPENILLVPDPTEPGGERAKVLDFGIAKVLDVSKHSSANPDDPPSYVTKTALTRVGTIVGTPAYMSPEQCRGGEIDGRSDIYACGVLLYQLVTGDLPFTGETPLHTAMRHIHAQPRSPTESRRDLAPGLERVITKALAKWPGERQQNAEQLRDELLATLPQLPDRGDVVLPEGFGAPRVPVASSRPSVLTPPPPKPGQSVRPTPSAAAPPTQAHREAAAAAPSPARSSGNTQATEGERGIEAPAGEVDPMNPTRQLVGGPLGGTPLRAVRLTRGATEPPPPVSHNAAVSHVPSSLAPLTTQPDAPLGGAARNAARDAAALEANQPPTGRHDDDDDPRTLNRPEQEAEAEAASTHDPIETPRTSPQQQPAGAAPQTGAEEKSPIEASKPPPPRGGHAPTLQTGAQSLLAQQGIAAGAASAALAAARNKVPRTEQLSQDQLGAPLPPLPPVARSAQPPPKPTADENSMGAQAFSGEGAQQIVRTRAGTDRPAVRAKPKPTQTGLTPTMQKQPPGSPAPGGPAGPPHGPQGIAAQLPPPPPSPPAARANTGSGAFEDPTLRRATAGPRNPTAPLPAAPHASFALSQSHLGHNAVVQAAVGQAAAQGAAAHAAAQQHRIQHGPPPVAAQAATLPHPNAPQTALPNVAAGDEDEPPTNVREIGGPPSNSGKTLVMEETTQGSSAPTHRRPHEEARPMHAPQPSNPGAVTGGARVDPSAYAAPQDVEPFRGLKATARIGAEESERATNPITFASTGENLQGVKATVRMNPQETMNAVANADPNSARQPQQARPGQQNMQPPSNRPAPGSLGQQALAQQSHGGIAPQAGQQAAQQPQRGGVPDLSFQQTGYRLAPGSWTEPTVVKRKSPASGAGGNREGLVSSLQGLSGTTGLLIGIGLGLGIAAGLLIAFLLARG